MPKMGRRPEIRQKNMDHRIEVGQDEGKISQCHPSWMLFSDLPLPNESRFAATSYAYYFRHLLICQSRSRS